jgi:hypothetical protein
MRAVAPTPCVGCLMEGEFTPANDAGSAVCQESPFGVLKICGAQTNWASHMRFAADRSETLEVFYWPQQTSVWAPLVAWPEDPHQECGLGYSRGHAPQNMARTRISSGRSPCYQGSPHRIDHIENTFFGNVFDCSMLICYCGNKFTSRYHATDNVIMSQHTHKHTIILTLDLHGCVALSLTVKEEHKLGHPVCSRTVTLALTLTDHIWVHTITPEHKKDEIIKQFGIFLSHWQTSLFTCFQITYWCHDIEIQGITIGWTCRLDEKDNKYTYNFGGEPLEDRPLWISRRRRDDNIKMDPREDVVRMGGTKLA